MRVMLHMPPPWAPSGYGVQGSLLARWLRDAGHEVAISAFGGHLREESWERIPVLGTAGRKFGNGLIAGNYARWKADVMILVCDAGVIDPGQFAGLHVISWMPIDCEQLSMLDQRWLDRAGEVAASLRVVAMSGFGRRMLAAAGQDAIVIPHCYDPAVYCPGDRDAWGREHGLADSAFLIAIVGVNEGTPSRKAFPQALQAFARFSARHPQARMYIHTEPQHPAGINVAIAAASLGLQGKVVFPDEYLRANDLLGADYMAGMYRRAGVLSAASMGEGFGVPIIEALACGTPVIATRCSAMTELIRPEYGRLVGGDPWWTHLHQSWWTVPDVGQLAAAYEAMHAGAASMRKAAARAAARFAAGEVMPMWDHVLASAA